MLASPPLLPSPPKPLLVSHHSSPPESSDAGLRFRDKLLFLQRDLRLDPAAALAANPDLRAAPLSSLRSLSALLLSRGFPAAVSSRLLSAHPHLLTLDPHLSLLPALDFLTGPAALPASLLPAAVSRCPRLLATSVPAQLHPALHFLRRLGFSALTPRTALLLVSSVEQTLIPKLQFLQSLGFSYPETKKMVLRSPSLLTCSIENNFRPKVDFLTGEMGKDVRELRAFPQYFSFSLEGKIKPRHRMLVESGLEVTLEEMLRPSDGAFREHVLELRLGLLEDGRL